jgi:UDP-N-acetylmuramate dehydrogenase
LTNKHPMTPFSSNVPLRDKTSLRIGGAARLYCEPASVDDVRDACTQAAALGARVLVLGKGTNVLISDKGWDGLVVDLSSLWAGVQWTGDCAGCKSGTLLHALVKESLERGLCGLEKLAGIPGTVGGAVVMNAGAFGQSVSDCLVSVRFITLPDGEIKTLKAQDINASYRSTIFKTSSAIILSAEFQFSKDGLGAAEKSFTEVLAKRKDRHPLDLPNCGSVFKNPPNTTAGTLIEQCGLKGVSRRAAEVSWKHANFIVNHGGASARDVRSLIIHVQKTVCEKTGVLLEPEVVFVGEFEEPLVVG